MTLYETCLHESNEPHAQSMGHVWMQKQDLTVVHFAEKNQLVG